jgi:GT2 family glycosyltransferase
MEYDLSVIIINYNTRQDLQNCLASIYKSCHRVKFQVLVVDNASLDGSASMVASLFPQVTLIRSAENLGFARANNRALLHRQSPFVLLLNPDTIIVDHVFDDTIDFLKTRPEVGMVTCKLVKADGSLDLACRRSLPTLFDGFCRASGLARLFPKSRIFARYNLTYLDENAINEVEAVNGAFMMVRSQAISDVGLLDEQFFMYGEDLDWCYRFRQQGWKIYYLPRPSVIHLKGQAGKKQSTRMIREFFRAMELYCHKHRGSLPRPRFATVLVLRLWMFSTLLRNAMRGEKRVTP